MNYYKTACHLGYDEWIIEQWMAEAELIWRGLKVPQRWHGGPSTQLWMREPCIQIEIRSEISVWINGRHGTVKKHWIGRAQKLSMLPSSSPRNRLYVFLSNVWLVCIGGDPLCRSMRSPLPPLIVVSLLCVLALGFVRDTLVLMDLGKHCAEH